MSCPHCHKDHIRSKNGPCPACYRKIYRKTEKGKDAVKRADKAYVRRNPEKRFEIVIRYRNKCGFYVPTELLALHHALKRLETALAATKDGDGIREPSQRRLQQSVERNYRFGNSEALFRDG